MAENVEFLGQILHPSWTYKFIDVGRIEAGQLIFPIEMEGQKANEFAALHLIIRDLEFALNCLREAGKIGIPDDENILARALIFAGLISYARPFDMGMRRFKLQPDDFKDIWGDESQELHSYLFDLRQKHIAHSVNDCERCDTVGVIVTAKDYKRQKGITGVGVTLISSIGLTKTKIDQADPHIQGIIAFVRERIEKLGIELHDELRAHLDGGGAWKMAPIARLPDANNVGARRR